MWKAKTYKSLIAVKFCKTGKKYDCVESQNKNQVTYGRNSRKSVFCDLWH